MHLLCCPQRQAEHGAIDLFRQIPAEDFERGELIGEFLADTCKAGKGGQVGGALRTEGERRGRQEWRRSPGLRKLIILPGSAWLTYGSTRAAYREPWAMYL